MDAFFKDSDVVFHLHAQSVNVYSEVCFRLCGFGIRFWRFLIFNFLILSVVLDRA